MFASLTDFLETMASQPGQVYRDLIPILLIATVAVVALHFVVALLTRPASRVKPAGWSWWERLIYLITVVAVADLGATAFYAVLRYGAMEGWALFVHVLGSGALVLALPLMAITWAEANRFGRARPVEHPSPEADDADSRRAPRFLWLNRLTFWIILASGFVTVSTMLVSMLPWYDTDGLQRMLDIHRYSGLLLVVATIFHLYGVWLRRLGLR